ncbi:hypothetical protein H4R21_004318, partial [Coemansia helicoidea]
MAACISALRRVRRALRAHTLRLGQQACEAVKFSAMPLVYANATQSPDVADAGPAAGVLDKARLNQQIPLKPVYIAPRNP